MTMTGGALAPLLAISPDKETSLAPPDDDPDMPMQPPRADAWPPNSDTCAAPTATVRPALRALASESGPGEGLDRVRLLRPLVAQAHDILRERFESGGSAEEYLRGRARLADSVVIGLLHIASISSGMRNGSMVAPPRGDCGGRLRTKRTRSWLRSRPAVSPPRKHLIPRRSCRAGDTSVHRRRRCLPLGSWLRAGSCDAVGPGMPRARQGRSHRACRSD